MAVTETEKTFGRQVIKDAEAFQVRRKGLGRPSDAEIDCPTPIIVEEPVSPGGLYGFSAETAQRLGRRFLIKDPINGWVPNTDTLIDER